MADRAHSRLRLTGDEAEQHLLEIGKPASATWGDAKLLWV